LRNLFSKLSSKERFTIWQYRIDIYSQRGSNFGYNLFLIAFLILVFYGVPNAFLYGFYYVINSPVFGSVLFFICVSLVLVLVYKYILRMTSRQIKFKYHYFTFLNIIIDIFGMISIITAFTYLSLVSSNNDSQKFYEITNQQKVYLVFSFMILAISALCLSNILTRLRIKYVMRKTTEFILSNWVIVFLIILPSIAIYYLRLIIQVRGGDSAILFITVMSTICCYVIIPILVITICDLIVLGLNKWPQINRSGTKYNVAFSDNDRT
jgi:hypothetical protein